MQILKRDRLLRTLGLGQPLIPVRGSVYVNHRDTDSNNEKTRFEFTP